ncbi:MAG: tripartite tricarboxylate transporter substrate binding protein [Burkholderiales bacterium]
MKRLLALALLLPCLAFAQAYPARPVRIIVPYPPGGATDVMARTVAQKLNESWQHAVVVENKAGASGSVGSEIVAKSAPDGYTLLVQGTQHAINLSLYKQLPYDTLRDFVPINYIASAPFLLVLHPSVPANTVAELIAYIKARPGGLNYGSSGVGGGAHLAGEIFKTAAGVPLTHIPYKGAAPAMADLLGGQVTMVFDPIPTSITQVRAGRLKALAITSAKRSALMPELPTVAESGLPGFDVSAWFGLYGPAAMPKDIAIKLNAEVNRILQLPEVKEKFAGLGAESMIMNTDQFAVHLRAEIAKFAKAIKDSGATAE